ncbi:NADH-quinone oxidoreductase subunit L, partial [Pseudomonas aeruginosa]
MRKGRAASAAPPFLTAGFYSKDEILWEAFASGNRELRIAGLVGAFLTYAGHGISHWLPLSVLIVLSPFVGALITPPLAGV